MIYIKQRGTAIFMALLIIAITASITVTMLRYQRMDLKRTQLMIDSEQAYLYAQGVIDWAAVSLKDDLAKNQTNPTVWPMRLPPTVIAEGQGKIVGLLEQAQSRININNLSAAVDSGKKNTGTQSDREVLLNLISILDPQQSKDNSQDLLNAISAWTSPNNQAQPTAMDNYDNQYSLLKPSYRSPHQPMSSISELRTVSGMTGALYQKLEPYLTALPTKTKIDASYASPILLQAMGLQAKPNEKASSDDQKNMNTYFLLRVDVFYHEQHFILYTLLKRDTATQGKLPTITQLWQSYGTI